MPSEYKKALGRHSTLRESRFAFWSSWPRTNNIYHSNVIAVLLHEKWPQTQNAPFSPVELSEPLPPFLSHLEEVLVVLARLGTKSLAGKRSSAEILLVPGHAAGSECDCPHVRLLRSVPAYQFCMAQEWQLQQENRKDNWNVGKDTHTHTQRQDKKDFQAHNDFFSCLWLTEQSLARLGWALSPPREGNVCWGTELDRKSVV